MSWICDYCSSNNDEETRVCFVCGCCRSAASIREARRKAKQKKIREFANWLYNKVFFAIKIAVISVVALFIIGLIIRIVQGDLITCMENNAAVIIRTMLKKMQIFAYNCGNCFEKVAIFSDFAELTENGSAVAKRLSEGGLEFLSNFMHMLPSGAKFDYFSVIFDRFYSNAATICHNVNLIFVSAVGRKTSCDFLYIKDLSCRIGSAFSVKFEKIVEYGLYIFGNAEKNIMNFSDKIHGVAENNLASIEPDGKIANRIVALFKK